MNQQVTDTELTQPTLTLAQRRSGWIIFRFIVGAIVIGLVLSAIVFRTWAQFWLALMVLVPYLLLLSAPTWLARLNRRTK